MRQSDDKKNLFFCILMGFFTFFFFIIISVIFKVPSLYADVTIPLSPDYKVPPGTTINPEEGKKKIDELMNPTEKKSGVFSDFCVKYPNICGYVKGLFDGQSFFKSTEEAGDQSVLPNNNTCNGYYDFNTPGPNGYNPLHKNFGDPKCEFASNIAKAKDDLKTLLNKLDNTHATSWFQMIQRESSYNPNAWASPATGTPDVGGAWGLLQMGQGSNTRPYDKGNVYWGNQINNAITDIKTRKYNTCIYWQAAKDLGTCFTVQ